MSFQVCNKCCLDNVEVPDITFVDGKCNYCIDYEATEMERQAEKTNLHWILHEIKKAGKGRKYDVLLGLSGGVDSSYCLHQLIQHGIRPYCFSMDNGYNKPEADENIMRLVEGLKVPFHRSVLDLEKFKELQMAFIKAGVKNLEIPTDHVLMAESYNVAEREGIKFIISGGNIATEGIMPESYGYQARDLTHIKDIYKKFVGKKLTGLPLISLWRYVKLRFVKRINTINILDYFEYSRDEAISLLSEKYGYKPYGEKHCENAFTQWFQHFYLPVKWKLDKRKPHFSSMINSGQMTRSEAMQELLKPLEYPEFGIEQKVLQIPKREHEEFKTNNKLWTRLSKTYAFLKRG